MFEQLDLELQKTQNAMDELHSFGQYTMRNINDRHAELHKVIDGLNASIGSCEPISGSTSTNDNKSAEIDEKLRKIDAELDELLAGL